MECPYCKTAGLKKLALHFRFCKAYKPDTPIADLSKKRKEREEAETHHRAAKQLRLEIDYVSNYAAGPSNSLNPEVILFSHFVLP